MRPHPELSIFWFSGIFWSAGLAEPSCAEGLEYPLLESGTGWAVLLLLHVDFGASRQCRLCWYKPAVMPPCAFANPGSSDSPVPLDLPPAVQKAAVPARLSEPKKSPSPRGHQLLSNQEGSFGVNPFWDSSFSSQVMQCELSFKPFWFIFMGMVMGEGMAQLCSHIQGRCFL